MSQTVILHHYPNSPYAEKIRQALDFKSIPWVSVEQPRILPRPTLDPLAHGYRRIPVLQIGSDVYCDTALILDELEKRFPEPSFYPCRKGSDKKDVGIIQSLAQWTDRSFFQTSASLIPWELLAKSAPEFVKDRSQYRGREIDPAEATRAKPLMKDHLRVHLKRLEDILSDGREWVADTETPSIGDIHLYMNPWFLTGLNMAPDVYGKEWETYPLIKQWFQRLTQFTKSKRHDDAGSAMSGEEAIEIAKRTEATVQAFADTQNSNDRKPGEVVMVIPDDTGKIPVVGVIVGCDVDQIAIRPHKVSGKGVDTVVHFPRLGYYVLDPPAKM
ncbi:hypothetical protein K7432_012440 [Basidiobolus ranarum]|uniref:Glutathione S-transferase n=1 Tax=Basidiobolus ranarum TaxID=34480 RepID=A0ABR2WKW0_9FUNG